MAIDLFEAFDSQKTKISRAAGQHSDTLRYFITGTNSRSSAEAALLANVPMIAHGRTIPDSVDLEPLGHNSWQASITYQAPEKTNSEPVPKAIGEATFSFDTSGGTHQLYEAFEQTKYGTGAPDHGKRIGVTADGVEGVSIVIPQMSMTLSQRFAGSTLTLSWVRTLVQATGKTNSLAFLGFEPGEVLFLGASGQQPVHYDDAGTVTAGERDVTFRFGVSPNQSGLLIEGITVTEKRGHDYLWLSYEDEEEASGNGLTRTPVGVYVARVYKDTDLNALGIVNPDTSHPVI